MQVDILWVGIGGFIGSISRFLLGTLSSRFWIYSFPMGTFLVNIIGCFVIGSLFGWWFKGQLPENMSRLWITGFCGGFTTFSSFSMEGLILLEEGKTGLWVAYVAGSVLIGLLATWAGITLVRQW